MLQNLKGPVNSTKEDILKKSCTIMTCFCGCDEFEKDPNGRILGCVKCTHGRQNHEAVSYTHLRAHET